MICPLDAKHTVSRSELKVFVFLSLIFVENFSIQDHIENRCNARLPCLPWIEANCNRSSTFENDDSPVWQQLSIEEKYEKVCGTANWSRPQTNPIQISALRTKINSAYEQHKHKIVDNFGQHSSMEALVGDKTVSDVKRKHYIQQSSIINRLHECNLLERFGFEDY